MKKSKILIVGAFPPENTNIFGGIATSCQGLLKSSFVKQFELILIDSTQISNPSPNLAHRGVIAMRRFSIFLNKLIVCRPSAIVLFTSEGASLLEKGVMAWTSRLFHIPVFIFPRGGQILIKVANSNFQRFWISTLMRGASHCLCQGPAWQRFAVRELGLPIERAPIISNWTATSRLLAIADRRTSTNESNAPKLLFLGWLEREKGIFELLEACQALSALYPFELIIAGRGHAEADARAWVEKKYHFGIVNFRGWVHGEALEELFSTSDILILPSWAEGLPNAMIEAMAAKLAVVVSSVGNVPDLITDGREALLVPPKEVKPLKLAIERLLVDKIFREELAARGHAFARDNFAVEPAVAKLTAVIELTIEEYSHRRKN